MQLNYPMKKNGFFSASSSIVSNSVSAKAIIPSTLPSGIIYAPKKYLDKIFEVLGLPEEDRQDFEDLAGATRGLSK